MGNDSLMAITLDKSVANNPKSIADLIVQLAHDIDSCKNDLSSIKDRGWWDKIVSNNTGDLASAMLKQNDTITLFLNIVQSIIMLHMHNTLILGQIQEHLNMHERSKGNFENKYTNMAKEFISQSYNAAISLKNKIENNEQTLLDFKKDIILKNEIDEQQTHLINKLRIDIDEHEIMDKEQHKTIQELKEELLEHDAIDEALRMTISGLKDTLKNHEILDKEQSQTIVELKEELLKHDEIDSKLHEGISRQSKQIQQLFSLLQNKDLIDSKQDGIIKDIQTLMTSYNDKLNNSSKLIDRLNSEVNALSLALKGAKNITLSYDLILTFITLGIITFLIVKL